MIFGVTPLIPVVRGSSEVVACQKKPQLTGRTKIMYDNSMNCALYARVSTADQNCQLQISELRDYVAKRGWEIAGEYIDAGVSGAKASRPELNRLMADAPGSGVDAVHWSGKLVGGSLGIDSIKKHPESSCSGRAVPGCDAEH